MGVLYHLSLFQFRLLASGQIAIRGYYDCLQITGNTIHVTECNDTHEQRFHLVYEETYEFFFQKYHEGSRKCLTKDYQLITCGEFSEDANDDSSNQWYYAHYDFQNGE